MLGEGVFSKLTHTTHTHIYIQYNGEGVDVTV
jgi:hypothetical protein